MQHITHDAPKSVRDRLGRPAKDKWIILDASELHTFASSITQDRRNAVDGNRQWYGGGSFADALEKCRSGDLSVVEKSDELLSEMSAYIPESARRGFFMDVAGAVPSVPAYLSGNPLNMRRRIKTRDEYAPIAIVYDPTCSAAISPTDIFKRGITVLALVRALSGLRPIELWVAGGLDMGHDGAWIATRIETAPLDLARAAYLMTSSAAVRAITYPLLYQHSGSGGAWPYRDHATSMDCFTDIVKQAMPHVSDVLAIPAIHIRDELITDPRAWLARTMRALTGQLEEAA